MDHICMLCDIFSSTFLLTLSEFTHRSTSGNCKWRTCPRSLHGG